MFILNKGSRLGLLSSARYNYQYSKMLKAVSNCVSLHSSSASNQLVHLKHLKKKYGSICSLCGTPIPGHRSLHSTQWHFSKRKEKKPIIMNPKSKIKIVSVWKNMTVMELAEGLNKTVDELFEVFIYIPESEPFDRPNSSISDMKVIQKAVKLAGLRFKIETPAVEEEDMSQIKDAFPSPPAPPEDLEPRPPIVTIMGHVDHGKTTLLDSLRNSSIVDTEFGGITQHIGAFEVRLPSGDRVTFLDTPGHAAFSAMRARGAHVTDLIVLVVACDDGVLPQTKESINLIEETGTAVVVAINKVDKPGVDVALCKESILSAGLQLEEQGGEIQAVEISALHGTNMDLLVEAIVTQAALLDLKETRKGLVEGTVIEAKLDGKRGKVATCIIKRGTLSKGAVIVADTSWAKVRGIFDFNGNPIEKALPGTPAQVIGWRDTLPSAGAELLEVQGERRAREVTEFREDELRRKKDKEDLEVIQKKLEDHLKDYKEQLENKRKLGIRRKLHRNRPPLEKMIKDDPQPRVSLVLKGDVDGSLDALLDVIDTYHSEEVRLDVLSYGVGIVKAGDIEMAKMFKGLIYTFNLPVTRAMKEMAESAGVPIREFNVIYRLIEDLQNELSEKMPLKPTEEIVGEATVLEEFMVSDGKKKFPVAGCRCVKGFLKKSLSFKVYRLNEVIHDGPVDSIRHLKSEVETIKRDVECGIMFKNRDLKFLSEDKIICYKIAELPQKVDWKPDGF